MLQARGLDVRYGTTHAVRGVDLDVSEGEAVALLGPNGAGKTSVLRAISQLLPHAGTVTFDGRPLTGRSPSEVARSGLVHVPEGRHVFPDLSVHENLQMGLVAAAGRAPVYGVDDVYDLFPALRRLRRRLGYALSGGEQQMVAVGRALTSAPRLLMLDEPSLGLAPAVTRVVFAALREIAGRTPVLLVEQNSAVALELCTQAAVLARGQVQLRGTAEQIRGGEELLASYLGQRDIGTHDAAAAHGLDGRGEERR